MRRPSIVEFTTSPTFLGLSLSQAQETLLRSIYGMSLDAEQRVLWSECTGGRSYNGEPYGEATVICGARSGKDSRVLAPVLLYEALFGHHQKHLGRGEHAMVPCVAQDARGARVLFTYMRDYLTGSSVLSSMVEEVLACEVVLTTRTIISIFPSTLRSLRGWSIPAAGMDEAAFFRLEGAADADVEIQASIRRGMLGFPRPKLLKASTPYLKGGVVYEDHRRAWGHDDPDLLCWVAPTAIMNPAITQVRLERERRLDPSRYEREYMARFVDDLDAFLPGAWVDAAVVAGRHELAPEDGVTYTASVDPSGGGADYFTMAVVHAEGTGAERRIVQDVMKSWRSNRAGTADLEGVVSEVAEVLRRYGVSTVHGDRYSGAWVRQAFERHGLRYEVPAFDKSDAYIRTEPLFAQGRVALLDHPGLVRELRSLERRSRQGGKVVVDHPGGRHDDHANALALAAAVASGEQACFDVAPVSLPKASYWTGKGAADDEDDDVREINGRLYVGGIVGWNDAPTRRRGWSH